jgi:hypothetical protein
MILSRGHARNASEKAPGSELWHGDDRVDRLPARLKERYKTQINVGSLRYIFVCRKDGTARPDKFQKLEQGKDEDIDGRDIETQDTE